MDAEVAHGVCMVVSMACFFPYHWMSSAFARMRNDSKPLELSSPTGLFVALRNATGVIALIAGIAFIRSGGHGNGTQPHDSLADSHKGVGWTVFTLVMVQVVLAIGMARWAALRVVHRWVGRVALILALGFQLWSGGKILSGWKTGGALLGYAVLFFINLLFVLFDVPGRLGSSEA
eukprot:m.116680 g.116680  ORF g.116680 m.116680 type:complete len:176 (+) comp16384_c0_seq4:450-977(+)